MSQSKILPKANRVYPLRGRDVVDLSASCKHGADDEVNISVAAARRFGLSDEAYKSFTQVCCHPFDSICFVLGTILRGMTGSD